MRDKMLCVFGVLKNPRGLFIRDRISEYLKKRFDIFYVEQDPPGVMFEYPAIRCALNMAIKMNEPVLYIHTKGAVDPHKMWYQKPAKQIWEHEFGTDKAFEIFEKIDVSEPIIATPLVGPNNATWYNAKVINPSAAKIILESFHFTKDRYFYEWDMQSDNRIKVIGTFISKIMDPGPLHRFDKEKHDAYMHTILNATRDLPEIDY